MKNLILHLLEKNETLNWFYKVDLYELWNIVYHYILPLVSDATYIWPKNSYDLPVFIKWKKNKKSKVVHPRFKNYEPIKEADFNQKMLVENLLERNGFVWKKLIKWIAECILANGWSANITRVIIPYIKEYYSEFYTQKYQEDNKKFNSFISSTVRSCPIFTQTEMWTFWITEDVIF